MKTTAAPAAELMPVLPRRLSEVGVQGVSHWHSLIWFCVFRLFVAGIFLLATQVFDRRDLLLGSQNFRLFNAVALVYFAVGAVFLTLVLRLRRYFDWQLSGQVMTDIVALSMLMYASGGSVSGIGFILLIVLAAAGLVGQGRLVLFYAAVASVAILIEQGWRILVMSAPIGDMFRAGVTSIAYFGSAITASLLARRALANEALARARGQALNEQLVINQRIIDDMEDGVLVVDAEGVVLQANPPAENLLDCHPDPGAMLSEYSLQLAERYPLWRDRGIESELMLCIPARGRLVRARFRPPGEGGHALIYLEDMARAQIQAAQIKLAALGRLAANMAHEIRNPLTAISHAAELIREDPDPAMLNRLTRIIGDNAQRLNRLVSDILELGRRDQAHPEPIALAAFVDQFLDEQALRDNDLRQRVQVEIDPTLHLCFDRAHLHRVLWNLLYNAQRHAGEGRIWLRANRSRQGLVEFHVIDEGPGIPAAMQAQIFEPFFTTHSKGSGLGLYIARELCEANDALLEFVDNVPGAHFRIRSRGEACQ